MPRALLALPVLLVACALVPQGGLPAEVYMPGPLGVTFAGLRVEGADPGSFRTLTRNGLPTTWGADATHGYFREQRLPGSHGPSLRLVEGPYAADRGQVYLGHGGRLDIARAHLDARASTLEVLPGADPATFRLLRPCCYWSADAERVFYRARHIDHADPATFRRVEGGPFWRDAEHLYTADGRVEVARDGGVHPARADDWRPIEGTDFATDGVGVWLESGRTGIPEADGATWRPYGDGNGRYSLDAERVFWRDNHGTYTHRILEGADPDTFEDLEGPFLVDADQVWYETRRGPLPLPGVDRPTWTRAAGTRYSHDAAQVWFGARPIEGAEVSGFEALGEGYARDGRRVYREGIPMSEVWDAATFEVVGRGRVRDRSGLWRKTVMDARYFPLGADGEEDPDRAPRRR